MAKRAAKTENKACDCWWYKKGIMDKQWVPTSHQPKQQPLQDVGTTPLFFFSVSMRCCVESDWLTLLNHLGSAPKVLTSSNDCWDLEFPGSNIELLHHSAAREITLSLADLLHHDYVRVFLEWLSGGDERPGRHFHCHVLLLLHLLGQLF